MGTAMTQRRQWDLYEALEEHGDAHGTGAQLEVTTELLVEAVERLNGLALPLFMEYAKEKLDEVT